MPAVWEVGDGFRELTDPDEQRRRFEADMAEKHRIYGEDYPIDEEFLEALAIMPAASGVALGVDRLVMLATAPPRSTSDLDTRERMMTLPLSRYKEAGSEAFAGMTIRDVIGNVLRRLIASG